jgi:hypothetical protein
LEAPAGYHTLAASRPGCNLDSTCRTARTAKARSRLSSDVSMLDWFLVTHERIPGKTNRWYVNGKLDKQGARSGTLAERG